MNPSWSYACALVMMSLICCIMGQSVNRTSFLILLVDDLGYGDVGYLNNGASLARTRNIDAMANAESTIQLHRFYSEAECTPSRVAIMSGRSPSRDCCKCDVKWCDAFFSLTHVCTTRARSPPLPLQRHGESESRVFKPKYQDDSKIHARERI